MKSRVANPRSRAASSVLAFVLALTIPFSLERGVGANDQLAVVKDLYQAAAYDEALAAIDGIATAPGDPQTAEVLEYRVLCLMALNRKDDARNSMAKLITSSPEYRLSESQAPPRIRAMFSDVRRSLYPALVRQAYTEARAAFDRKDPEAGRQFDRVLTLLADPDAAALADLVAVVTGFRDLSQAAVPPAPAPAPVPVTRPASRPSAATATFVPPVAISQTFPPMRLREAREWDGEIEVVIDEAGKVAAARMRKRIHPLYDIQLVQTARTWTYKPALRDGVPSQIVKVVAVHLDSRPTCTTQQRGNCRPPQ